jgi:hypothetical protein
MPIDKEWVPCFLCGKTGVHWHHPFKGKAKRKTCNKYKIGFRLCLDCHELAPWSTEHCFATAEYLRQQAQIWFEREFGTREDFMRVFMGMNYLSHRLIEKSELCIGRRKHDCRNCPTRKQAVRSAI